MEVRHAFLVSTVFVILLLYRSRIAIGSTEEESITANATTLRTSIPDLIGQTDVISKSLIHRWSSTSSWFQAGICIRKKCEQLPHCCAKWHSSKSATLMGFVTIITTAMDRTKKHRNFRKLKFSKCYVVYYPNATATRRILLLCGDIESNPGWQYGTSESENTVNCRDNSSRIGAHIPVRITNRMDFGTRSNYWLQQSQWTTQRLNNNHHVKQNRPHQYKRAMREHSRNRAEIKRNRNHIIINTHPLPEPSKHTDQNKVNGGQSHCIKISHLNVRSLKNRENFHQVNDLISSGDFDVFTVSESWLSSTVKNSEVNVNGYRLIRLDRTSKTGGGVCAYVRNSLKVKILHDLTATSADGFQQLWFSLQHKKLKSLVICVAYRPPDCPTTCFTNDLIPTFSQAATLGRDIIIAGDLNCNLLTDSNDSRMLRDLCHALNLTQLISDSTRITESSETLIDVMLISNTALVRRSGVLNITISDHFLVHCTLNLKSSKPKPTIITTRSYKNFNSKAFCSDISRVPWDTIELFEDVDDQVSTYNKLFLDVLEQHAPLKTFKAKYRKSQVINPEIQTLMSQRDSQHKRARQTSLPCDWEAYRALRQEVKFKIRLAETEFVRNEITSNKENKTSIWKTVRRCLTPSGHSGLSYSRDCTEVADEFNEFFTSVGDKAANQATQLALDFDLPPIRTVLSSLPTVAGTDTTTKFTLERVSKETVKKIIMGMPSNKSPGYDKVSMSVIKTCLPHILQVITNMFNTSLTTGYFPKDWKQAEVIAHPKEGDHEVASNNRPISLLPVLSKVMERIVHDQFVGFLTSNNKFSAHQSGNKKLHSTETLGILFSSHLYKAIDEKQVTAVLMLDLSKAFDSIQHEALLMKLRKLDVADETVAWFASYLEHRQQRVRINNSLSSPLTIKHGVPQGSILGPLLFNLYINDLPSACNTCKVESYVDDSKLYLSFSNKDMEGGLQDLKSDLLHVASWCCTNRLLINPGKTKFCVFGSHKMLSQVSIPSLTFMGKELPVENAVKDLGVVLDRSLSFNEHVTTLVSDLMGKLCMISRIKHLLDQSTLFTVINSLVFTKLFYCSSVWSGTSKSNIAKLQLVQNFAARLLSGRKKFDHITPTLKQLKLLPISDLLYVRDAVQIYKCMNDQAPRYLTDLFRKRSSVHSYNTRNSDCLQLPSCRTALAQKSFEYRGAHIWNRLPKELRNCSSVSSFKRRLKANLMSIWLNAS